MRGHQETLIYRSKIGHFLIPSWCAAMEGWVSVLRDFFDLDERYGAVGSGRSAREAGHVDQLRVVPARSGSGDDVDASMNWPILVRLRFPRALDNVK